VLTPAIFWKRAAAVHRGCLSGFYGPFGTNSCEVVFGGAGLGTAAGYFTHIARSASGDVPPTPPVVSDS
jgi:hypothetical protein